MHYRIGGQDATTKLKWILRILEIARTIKMRRSTIILVIELLRQFNRSLANSEGQSKLSLAGKVGFVYVIRDRANGERFKIGHRAKLPRRDSQLRSDLGESGDFVLIIPAKDASALEKRLRQAYARHSKKSDWFALDDGELREVLIIAALVQLVAGDDLGMSAVDQEIVQLAMALLTQLQGLANTLWNKIQGAHQQPDQDDGVSEIEPDLDDFSAIPDMDWNWESVLDEDYRGLPTLKGKHGYVCIIRDNNTKTGKVFFDNHPVTSIEAAFLETDLQFALEVVLVLKVENKKKVREALLTPSVLKDGAEWVELSFEELGELRQSATEERTHGSLYMKPKDHWSLVSLTTDNHKKLSKLEKPDGYVYLIQKRNSTESYKLGRTQCPARSRSVTRNNLLCLYETPYAESVEKFLKKRFIKSRTRHEWHKLTDTQVREICRMGDS